MHDNNDRNEILFNPSNVVIPQGWRVISHGTSFKKWNTPMSGRPSQDLKATDSIIIHDTVDDGLACVGEKEESLALVYAGKDAPVLFRVFVPSDLSGFDVNIADDILHFLKPEKLQPKFFSVPTGTKLIKLAENTEKGDNAISVIWYVPEQFYPLLKKDFEKQKAARERARADEADVGVPGFDINTSFAAAEEVLEEEHILEQEEKADEYFEDLEDQLQDLVDAEIEAEEELAEKRDKDKKKAREQDKKNFAEAQKEYERQQEEANKTRYNSETGTGAYGSGGYPGDSGSGESYPYETPADGSQGASGEFGATQGQNYDYKEPYSYENGGSEAPYEYSQPSDSEGVGREADNGNAVPNYNDGYNDDSSQEPYRYESPGSSEPSGASNEPYNTSNEFYEASDPYADEARRRMDSDVRAPEYDTGSFEEPKRYENYDYSEHNSGGFESGGSKPVEEPPYSDGRSDSYSYDQAPNGGAPSYDDVNHKDYSDDSGLEHYDDRPQNLPLSDADVRNRKLMDDDFERAEIQRKDDDHKFQEDLQAEALRRQERSENYTSFGSSGIDFSGHDDHTAYAKQGSQGYDTPRYETSSEGPKAPQTISSQDYKNYEENFRVARDKFRNYNGDVPEHVAREYKEASDKFYNVQRKIDEGTVVVSATADVKPSGSAGGGSAVNRGSSGGSGSGSGSRSSGGEGKPPRTTAQNTQTGDAPTPRSATSLKDPPKSPADLRPLTFGPDRFRAIRRWANSATQAELSVGRAVRYQVVQMASAEDTGTARTVSSFGRNLSDTAAVLDIVCRGSGKEDAQKAMKKYLSEDQIAELGKLNVKNLDGKLKEGLTDKDLAGLKKKYGKAADVSVSDAVGTKNGKIGKQNAFTAGKVNVKVAEGKIGALRERSANLKAEMRVLQAKDKKLTIAERNKYADLVKQKKAADEQLKKLVGATNERHRKESLYRRINSMSPNKLKKELGKLEKQLKNGIKLNKVQMQQLKAMRERMGLLAARKAMGGRELGRRVGRLTGVGIRHLGKMLRKSGDETFSSMASMVHNIQYAQRFTTNRYVKSALKWSVKVAMLPVKSAMRLAKIVDRKYGVSKAVKKNASRVVNDVSSKIRHSKPATKIQSAKKRAVGHVKDAYKKSHLKKAVDKGAKAVNKGKKIASAIRKAFEKFNKNPVVRGVKGVLKAPFSALKFLNKGIQAVKSFVSKYFIIPVAWFVAIAFVVSILANVIASIPGGVVCNEDEADGKIDLSAFVETINDEQEKINKKVENHKNNTEASGGKYKQVFVNYLGSGSNSNAKEILSMAAVYFQQDFSNKDAINEYISHLYEESNYVTTSESEKYYCSGCEEREYHCYDKPDEWATAEREKLYKASNHSGEKNVGNSKGCKKSSYYSCMTKGHGTYSKYGCGETTYHEGGQSMYTVPEGCNNYTSTFVQGAGTKYQCKGHGSCHGKHYDYSCPGHKEKICKGHIDLYVNVTCVGFDELFEIDPDITVGKDLGDYEQGDLIDTFEITYYCAERYPHICNAGPPYKTATGTDVTPGRTIAVDPNEIPLNSRVVINGHVYVAEDTGGAIDGKHIDVAVATHEEAEKLGVKYYKVYKAKEKGEDNAASTIHRMQGIDYFKKAQEVSSDSFVIQEVLQCFGLAKEPEVKYRPTTENARMYAERIQDFDVKHKNEAFTNAELNAFEYVQMSLDELQKLAKQRDKDNEYTTAVNIITKVLIPYDKKHPDNYVKPPDSEENKSFYFEGWTEENREWTKTIYGEMTSEVYAGLEDIVTGGGASLISLEGVTIQGSKIEVTYYSQHDSRWGNKAIRPESPANTISRAGCGFTSMAIVVSSLTDVTIDPPGMCAIYGKRYYVIGAGASTGIVKGVSKDYGLTCNELSATNIQGVINALKEGKLVVARVGSRGGIGYTGNGYYTGLGHFLVICGVTEDGKFLLADPNKPGVSTSGKGVDMQHFLNSGIKNFWAIGR